MKVAVIFIVLSAVLGGCASNGILQGLGPVCEAISANADPEKPGPIKYTSTNKKSARYAGPQLAPDLASRNGVGENLKCPNF